MISIVRRNLLFSEGSIILVTLLVGGLLGFFLFKPLFYIAIGLLIFCLYFFRNPERSCPQALEDPSLLVAPADGRVIKIQYDPHNGFEGYAYKVSIFLSVFDVHVNRMPLSGTVDQVVYKPGSFKPAFVPKSSDLNERNDLVVVHDDGKTMIVRQIAGIIARRIRCWVRPGSFLTVGQRYGMIMFGSRVDLLLPSYVELYSTKGQRVYGGQTIMGRLLCK